MIIRFRKTTGTLLCQKRLLQLCHLKCRICQVKVQRPVKRHVRRLAVDRRDGNGDGDGECERMADQGGGQNMNSP